MALAILGLPPIAGSLMRPELAPLSFQLAIQSSGGSISVSWPITAVDYVLETSGVLLPGDDWQEITDGMTVVDSRHVYQVPASEIAPQFFRLRKSTSTPAL
jgi:hypothetical protein